MYKYKTFQIINAAQKYVDNLSQRIEQNNLNCMCPFSKFDRHNLGLGASHIRLDKEKSLLLCNRALQSFSHWKCCCWFIFSSVGEAGEILNQSNLSLLFLI